MAGGLCEVWLASSHEEFSGARRRSGAPLFFPPLRSGTRLLMGGGMINVLKALGARRVADVDVAHRFETSSPLEAPPRPAQGAWAHLEGGAFGAGCPEMCRRFSGSLDNPRTKVRNQPGPAEKVTHPLTHSQKKTPQRTSLERLALRPFRRGGGGGTRTPKGLRPPHFECGALPVRATPPWTPRSSALGGPGRRMCRFDRRVPVWRTGSAPRSLSGRPDSNRGPLRPERSALPD